jgi:hypothetical protein
MNWSKIKNGTIVRYDSDPSDESHPCWLIAEVRRTREDGLQRKILSCSPSVSDQVGQWLPFNPVDSGYRLCEVDNVESILKQYDGLE